MGYSTDFYGEFSVDPPLKPEHREYLHAFANTRRLKRDADLAEKLPDPIRIAAGLTIGYEGAYFVGGDGYKGQAQDPSVLDHNEPPGAPVIPPADLANPMADWNHRWATEQSLKKVAQKLGLAQPGLWCQWVPSDDGAAIRWDGGEKFYNYVEWIEYLVEHFLRPWGYRVDGEVQWQGEDREDMGMIRIDNNEVLVLRAHITWR